MNKEKIYFDLTGIVGFAKVRKDEPLNYHTYTKTGGSADFLVFPSTYQEIKDIIIYANNHSIPLTILGNGSNLIIRDGGIRGIVLHFFLLNNIKTHENRITAQSGVFLSDVSKTALKFHLTGLEFACGIPGTVGGAVYMNAGAYEGEVSDVLESAVVLTKSGEILTLSNHELEFEYRNSLVCKNNLIVLEATFILLEGEYNEINTKMEKLTSLRKSKQPLEYPSCGSVFKRPLGHFAGQLIQESGLQGYQIGGVQVSTKHAGFMVNVDNGTASDYLKLIEYVQDKVKNTFDIQLETEVKIIGEDLSGLI